MLIFATIHSFATPTPNPDKIGIWALKVARHSDSIGTAALNAANYANVIASRTFWATVVGLLVATLAAFLAWRALRKTQQQLDILLRKPDVSLGLCTQVRLPLGEPLDVYSVFQTGTSKKYIVALAAQNHGDIEAENYRLSVVLNQNVGVSVDITDKSLSYLPLLQVGAPYQDPTGTYNEYFVEGRAIQVSPMPVALAQLTLYKMRADPVVANIVLRLACGGGNFFEHAQQVTFL